MQSAKLEPYYSAIHGRFGGKRVAVMVGKSTKYEYVRPDPTSAKLKRIKPEFKGSDGATAFQYAQMAGKVPLFEDLLPWTTNDKGERVLDVTDEHIIDWTKPELQELYKLMQETEGPMFLIFSGQSGGTGFDFHNIDGYPVVTVKTDPSFNVRSNKQSDGRGSRSGEISKGLVMIPHFLNKLIESRMINDLQQKNRELNAASGDKDVDAEDTLDQIDFNIKQNEDYARAAEVVMRNLGPVMRDPKLRRRNGLDKWTGEELGMAIGTYDTVSKIYDDNPNLGIRGAPTKQPLPPSQRDYFDKNGFNYDAKFKNVKRLQNYLINAAEDAQEIAETVADLWVRVANTFSKLGAKQKIAATELLYYEPTKINDLGDDLKIAYYEVDKLKEALPFDVAVKMFGYPSDIMINDSGTDARIIFTRNPMGVKYKMRVKGEDVNAGMVFDKNLQNMGLFPVEDQEGIKSEIVKIRGTETAQIEKLSNTLNKIVPQMIFKQIMDKIDPKLIGATTEFSIETGQRAPSVGALHNWAIDSFYFDRLFGIKQGLKNRNDFDIAERESLMKEIFTNVMDLYKNLDQDTQDKIYADLVNEVKDYDTIFKDVKESHLKIKNTVNAMRDYVEEHFKQYYVDHPEVFKFKYKDRNKLYDHDGKPTSFTKEKVERARSDILAFRSSKKFLHEKFANGITIDLNDKNALDIVATTDFDRGLNEKLNDIRLAMLDNLNAVDDLIDSNSELARGPNDQNLYDLTFLPIGHGWTWNKFDGKLDLREVKNFHNPNIFGGAFDAVFGGFQRPENEINSAMDMIIQNMGKNKEVKAMAGNSVLHYRQALQNAMFNVMRIQNEGNAAFNLVNAFTRTKQIIDRKDENMLKGYLEALAINSALSWSNTEHVPNKHSEYLPLKEHFTKFKNQIFDPDAEILKEQVSDLYEQNQWNKARRTKDDVKAEYRNTMEKYRADLIELLDEREDTFDEMVLEIDKLTRHKNEWTLIDPENSQADLKKWDNVIGKEARYKQTAMVLYGDNIINVARNLADIKQSELYARKSYKELASYAREWNFPEYREYVNLNDSFHSLLKHKLPNDVVSVGFSIDLWDIGNRQEPFIGTPTNPSNLVSTTEDPQGNVVRENPGIKTMIEQMPDMFRELQQHLTASGNKFVQLRNGNLLIAKSSVNRILQEKRLRAVIANDLLQDIDPNARDFGADKLLIVGKATAAEIATKSYNMIPYEIDDRMAERLKTQAKTAYEIYNELDGLLILQFNDWTQFEAYFNNIKGFAPERLTLEQIKDKIDKDKEFLK